MSETIPDDVMRAAEKVHLMILGRGTTYSIGVIIKAILAESSQKHWQDISTAPKDGTKILVCSPARCWKTPEVAFWGRDGALNEPAWVGGHCHINHIDQPTHWQPLPRTPDVAAKGEQ